MQGQGSKFSIKYERHEYKQKCKEEEEEGRNGFPNEGKWIQRGEVSEDK